MNCNTHSDHAKLRAYGGQLLFFAGILLLWQLLYAIACSWLSLAKPYALPTPAGVASSLYHLAKKGTLLSAAAGSLTRALAGFLIAILVGILFGIFIIHSKFLAKSLKPLILGVQTLPSICWVPFAILWFGLTEGAILFVIVMGSAFGIALSIEGCVKNVPPIYVKVAKTMGLSSFPLYRRVIFPAALPSFLTGLKQGWSFAWRALMSGEVMSASMGLGHTLMMGRDLADINQVMAVMLVILLIGVLIDKAVFSPVESHVLKKRGLSLHP